MALSDKENYHQRFWNWWATRDPSFAICADPTRKGNWNQEEFFQTGEVEVEFVMDSISSIPKDSNSMLDFGCGMGRITRAFRKYFATCHGVDISPEMIKKAQNLNPDVNGLEFVVSDLSGLKSAPEAQYDFIYSSLVFQHLEPNLTQSYIQALLRLIKPNGLFVFQTTDNYRPSHNFTIAEAKNRLLQNGAASFLRESIENRGVILTRSVRMYGLDEERVRQTVMEAGGNVFDVKITNHTSIDSIGNLKFLPDEPTTGWISKLYYAQKNS